MKLFKVVVRYEERYVVAGSYAEAEAIINRQLPYTKIDRLELVSRWVYLPTPEER